MLTRDRIGALIMLAFSIGYGVMSEQIPLLPFQANAAFTAKTMPQALAVLGVVFSLILLFRPMRSDEKASDEAWRNTMLQLFRPLAPEALSATGRWPLMRVLLLCVLMVFYGFTVRWLGFLISTSIFLIGGMLVLGERRPIIILVASVPVVVFFWVVMTQFLGVYIAPWPDFLTE